MLPSISETASKRDTKRASMLMSEGSSQRDSPKRASLIHLTDPGPEGIIEMPMTKNDSTGMPEMSLHRVGSPQNDYESSFDQDHARGLLSEDIRIFSQNEQLYLHKPRSRVSGRGGRPHHTHDSDTPSVQLKQHSLQLERKVQTPKHPPRLQQKQYRAQQRSNSQPKQKQKKPIFLSATKKNPDNIVVNLKTSYGIQVQKLTLQALANHPENKSLPNSSRSEHTYKPIESRYVEFSDTLNIQKITAVSREHQISIDASTESDPRHESSPSPPSKRNSPELRIEEHPHQEQSHKKAVIPNRFMNTTTVTRPSTQQRLQDYYAKVNKQLEKESGYIRQKSGPHGTPQVLPGEPNISPSLSSNHPPFPPQLTKIKRVVKQKFSPEVRNKLKRSGDAKKSKIEKVREFVPAVSLDVKQSLEELSDLTHESRTHGESHFSRISKLEKNQHVSNSDTLEGPSESQPTPRESEGRGDTMPEEATFGEQGKEEETKERKVLEEVAEESTPTEDVYSQHPSVQHLGQRENSIQEQLYSNKEQLISSLDQVKTDFLKGEESHFKKVIKDRDPRYSMVQEAALAFKESHFHSYHNQSDDLQNALFLAGLQAEGDLHQSRTGIILENIREETTESAGDSQSVAKVSESRPSRAHTVMERRPSTPSFMPDTSSQGGRDEKCQSQQQELKDTSQHSPAILEDRSGIESKNESETSQSGLVIDGDEIENPQDQINISNLIYSPHEGSFVEEGDPLQSHLPLIEEEMAESPFENTANMTRLLNLTSDQSLHSGRNIIQASPGSRFSFINNDNSGKRLFRSKSKLNLSQGSLMTMEYQNSKILPENYERHAGSLEIMSPPSASSQVIVTNPPMSPLGAIASGGLGTSSTGKMGVRILPHESIEEEEQEIEQPDTEAKIQETREKRLIINQNQFIEDDSLAQLSSYLETLTPDPQDVHSLSSKSRIEKIDQKSKGEEEKSQQERPLTRTVVTLQVQPMTMQNSRGSISNLTLEDTILPNGILSGRTEETTVEPQPRPTSPPEAPAPVPQQNTPLSPPRSPRSTRSVISKIHFPKADRPPLLDRVPGEITLQSMEAEAITIERMKTRFQSSPDLKKLQEQREMQLTVFSLSELPPRYPFGARHASITVPPEMMKRGCSDLLSSKMGSRIMANRDSQTSIDNGELAPVEFNVRAISRLSNHSHWKSKTPLSQKDSVQQQMRREMGGLPHQKNFILHNKRMVKRMQPVTKDAQRRENLPLQEVRLLPNQEVRSKELLALLTEQSTLSPIDNAQMQMRASLPSQHQKNLEKFRKLLFSQGGGRPLTPAQKLELLGTFSPQISPMREGREQGSEMHERSKSLTPVPNQNVLSKRSSQDPSVRERTQSISGTQVPINSIKPKKRMMLEKSSKDSCESVTLKEILESQKEREESKTPDSNQVKLPKLEQLPGYSKGATKEEKKTKQIFKPGSGGPSHSTIKGKLHGIMPQTVAVHENVSVGKRKKTAKPGYRQCKLIEDVEKAVASLGPVKHRKQASLGLTGLKKELQKTTVLVPTMKQSDVVVIRVPKRKKREDSVSKSKGKRQERKTEEDLAQSKDSQIMGMAFHKWGRESVDESHNEISVVDDLLSGGARLQ